MVVALVHRCNPGSGTWCSIDPSGYKAFADWPPVGLGRFDCWTLVRDWYQEERGIKLRDWGAPRTTWRLMLTRCLSVVSQTRFY